MSKGPKIKDWVKWYIRTEALKNRDEPRDSVAERIEKYLDGKEGVPSRDTINKKISSARSNDPGDSPWGVSDIAKCHIPPEAVPTVLKVWANTVNKKPITIKQALWIARLYHVFQEAGLLDNMLVLMALVNEYASQEKAYMPTEEHSVKPEDMWWRWVGDATLYQYMTGDDGPMLELLKRKPSAELQERTK